jgi:AmiR/NasT family two-component response regulator
MGVHHLTEDQAFDVLRRYSQDKNIKLREVARQIYETGSVS